MSRTVRIVERASTDVDEIFNWLAPQSVQGAVSWYLGFRRAVDRIGESPELHSEALRNLTGCAETYVKRYFKTRRGRTYRIVFEVSETDVIILRVGGPGQAPLRRRDLPDQ